MFIELKEFNSQETNLFNSDDFKRVQKTRDLVCITFRDGGEILFDENYDELMKKLKS